MQCLEFRSCRVTVMLLPIIAHNVPVLMHTCHCTMPISSYAAECNWSSVQPWMHITVFHVHRHVLLGHTYKAFVHMSPMTSTDRSSCNTRMLTDYQQLGTQQHQQPATAQLIKIALCAVCMCVCVGISGSLRYMQEGDPDTQSFYRVTQQVGTHGMVRKLT